MMRRILAVLAAAWALSGCASMLDSAYEDQTRRQCEQENYGRDRINC